MASSAQWLTFTKPFCGIAFSVCGTDVAVYNHGPGTGRTVDTVPAKQNTEPGAVKQGRIRLMARRTK